MKRERRPKVVSLEFFDVVGSVVSLERSEGGEVGQ